MGLGFAEGLLVALIGVIFLKPRELSDVATRVGKWIRRIRKMSDEFTSDLKREIDRLDVREDIEKIKKDLYSDPTGQSSTGSSPPVPEMDGEDFQEDFDPSFDQDPPAADHRIEKDPEATSAGRDAEPAPSEPLPARSDQGEPAAETHLT